VLSVRDRYLPHRAVIVLATITVTTPAGARTAQTRVTLLPRPPLPLTVSLAQKAVRVGQPWSVQVSSVPGTRVSLTVILTNTVLARGSGLTNAQGRWRYTSAITTALPRAAAARIVVQAQHGLDQRMVRIALLLQPAQPGVPDRLASAGNPAPDLARYVDPIPNKLIMVSVATTGQTLRAYQDGVLVHEAYVTTGQPLLPTPPGIYHVLAKYAPFEFISPWPLGSPFYYPPSWTHFAMLFRDGGYFLHDATWRTVYGPGTNLPHASDPGEPNGTHGCINIPYPDMVWLWNWTPIGTTVVVY
jgi:lipoprotein-anchoring transpeptidase ErfK/SrfK